MQNSDLDLKVGFRNEVLNSFKACLPGHCQDTAASEACNSRNKGAPPGAFLIGNNITTTSCSCLNFTISGDSAQPCYAVCYTHASMPFRGEKGSMTSPTLFLVLTLLSAQLRDSLFKTCYRIHLPWSSTSLEAWIMQETC